MSESSVSPEILTAPPKTAFQEPSFDKSYTLILTCAALIFFIISVGVNIFLFRYAQDSTISQTEKNLREQVYNLDLLTFSMIQGFGRVQSVLEGPSLFSYDQVRESLSSFLSSYQKFYGRISQQESYKSCILHGAGSAQNLSLQTLDMMGRFLSHAPKVIPDFLANFPSVLHLSYVSKEFNMNCPWEGFPPYVDPDKIQDMESFLAGLKMPFLNNFPKWYPLMYQPYERIWAINYVLPSFYDNILKGFFIFTLPQKFFFNFLDPLKLPFGKVFLVDQENTIMAELGQGANQSSVSFLKDKISPDLMTSKHSIFLTPSRKMVYYPVGLLSGYWVCTIPLQKAPWKIVFIGTSWEVAKNDLYATFGDTLMLIMSLVLMVGLSHRLMRSYFFKPAVQLINHLNQERQGIEANVQKLPLHWQPWGFLISKTFSENRHLVMELETRVQQRTQALKKALKNLQDSQKQIIAQEKLASLGTLVAGIAHEMKNPLNFVINFAEISRDFVREIKKNKITGEQSKILLQDLENNMARIIEYAERTDYIVKSMLLHARSGPTSLEETDLNRLLEEYIDLCHQSFIVQNPHTVVEVKKNFDPNLPLINVCAQDIGRVFLNILNNAFGTVQSKFLKMNAQEGPQETTLYKPLIFVFTQNFEDSIVVTIQDNGEGIPPEIMKKIFDPFFTTKSPGQGTGLGLSISYDCIQRHRGSLDVESKKEEGTKFFIRIPKNLLFFNNQISVSPGA